MMNTQMLRITAYLLIDNVINMMNYPFPSLETSAKKYRAAGVGTACKPAYLMAKGWEVARATPLKRVRS